MDKIITINEWETGPKRGLAYYREIWAKTSFATAHIFDHGGHPAMMSNMAEFVSLCEEFFA